MTKKELEIESRTFVIAGMKLARTLERLKKSIEAIEKKAQENEGELTPDEATRHEILRRLYWNTYEEVGKVLNTFP